MKKIGIMTTGGDCSGLNTVIQRIIRGATFRNWSVVGILDGTDGLYVNPIKAVSLDVKSLPIENLRLAGSILGNGDGGGGMNFETAAKCGKLKEYDARLRTSLKELNLDAFILIGGNGSFSLAWRNREIYSNLQLVCIPKTIDMDIPLTESTIGFSTAVQQLVSFCDQLILTAHSHHKWLVVQTMGRKCGHLALHAGVAMDATAILIPEIRFNMDELINSVKRTRRDYGIILAAEGVTIRGHSGRPADIISKQLTAKGIANRAEFPEHFQRTGDTTAADRILATKMADCALEAIENKETFVMTALQNGMCRTVSLADVYAAGELTDDPKIVGLKTSDACVSPDEPLLYIAQDMGIYIGEVK